MGKRAQRRQRRTTEQRAHDKRQRSASADLARVEREQRRGEWARRREEYFAGLKRGELVERVSL